jgi:Zn-dependent peptidase ImmA (M78 family)/transcriptional regulator with XRE-family HTH domain
MTGELFRTRELPQVIAERIKEAREARGFTREAFADLLGVTPQAVGQYEVGQNAPGPDTMRKIINVTGQPPAFFTGERRSRERTGRPNWRSLARMARPDRQRIARRLEWAADIVSYIERFIELPPPNLPQVDLPASAEDFATIERAAEKVREAWALGDGPITHLAPTLEANGIVLIKEFVNCADMDAVSHWQSGKPYIFLASDKGALPRENFDLAHELGHLLLHAHVEVTSENLPTIERQANYFAGALLLPRKSFPQEVLSTSINYFLELKSRWRVSVQAMVYRCKDLGLLSKHQVSYLWRQFAQRNMRSTEPLDDAFEPEKPSILSASLAMLIDNGVQSRAQIVDALKLNPADVESLSGTREGFLSQNVIPLVLKQKTT